ncbi:MAG: pyridoxamine 5'-phosphate oxidase family protein [Candidatus Omnitrophica bacterium]|nr:pyridoxamine 5'-phosphate oxidase family protein [Candidatus Omnitrophota bacterium]
MIDKKVQELLLSREFLYVATCDRQGRPNVAPKLLLKIENNYIFLVDYTVGRTYRNLKEIPRVSISIMDLDNLTGYQLNGNTVIIEDGPEHKKFLKEFAEKEVGLSATRIIEGVEKGKRHKNFEIGISKNAVIFKAVIEEIIEIAPQGGTRKT